jgi:DNA-binding Xre family transcriptional regulator
MKIYIKERAKENGISLTDIFNELGLKSYPSFLRTLDNSENLKLKQLQTIASKIGCTIDDLLCAPGTPSSSGGSFKCPHCGADIHITID